MTTAYGFLFLFTSSLCGLGALRLWIGQWLPARRTLSSILQQAEKEVCNGKLDAALQTLKPIVYKRWCPENAMALYAYTLRSTQQWEEAAQFCHKILKRTPSSLLHRERAKALLAQGRAKQALSSFEQCAELLTREEDLFDLATALYLVGREDDAWAQLEPLLNSTRCGRVHALAGDCQYRWQHHEQAVVYYLRAQTHGWKSHRLLLRMGHALLECGHPEKAMLYFRTLIERDGADIEATLALGLCYERIGDHEQALRAYQSEKAWDQGDRRILQRAGICALHTGQIQFAEIYLREALGTKNDCLTLAHLGHCFEQQRQWKEAEECYQQLVSRFPDHAAGYRGLAWLFGIGRIQQLDGETARAYAEQALTIVDDVRGWELLSACEARLGNFERAREIHERLAESPADVGTQQRRRNALRTLRQYRPLDERLVGQAMVA